ncbi:hypothetical protein [Enterococcus faecalis]|uniref:hypothetical protein n=1 Tax=Enterococcus faecalis TaxID=1351 RepID=UPI002477FB29|nr:hypothetical protein [Enterococcus faecalis]
MTIARKLREDLDKQIFDTQSNMIELKYATRHVARKLKRIAPKRKLIIQEF